MRPRTLILAAAVVVGCGGGGGDDPTTRASPTATTTAERTPEATPAPPARPARVRVRLDSFPVPAGSHPHDVAPARGGRVWYTAQHTGRLGLLDPRTGDVEEISLGAGSAPHGVIVGPGGAAWVTDGGLNAIVRVDDRTHRVRVFPLPADRPDANLNTATFSGRTLWFTGQSGIYGRLDTRTGRMRVFDAPRGAGPYGIATTPRGGVYYASLAGSYLGRIDRRTGRAAVLAPPTPGQGARRVWSDSRGRLWISEYVAGRLGRYDPSTRRWREWKLPGDAPQRTRSTSTIATSSGSATSPRTGSCASTRRAGASGPTHGRQTAQRSASSSAGPASSGARSREPTHSSEPAPPDHQGGSDPPCGVSAAAAGADTATQRGFAAPASRGV